MQTAFFRESHELINLNEAFTSKLDLQCIQVLKESIFQYSEGQQTNINSRINIFTECKRALTQAIVIKINWLWQISLFSSATKEIPTGLNLKNGLLRYEISYDVPFSQLLRFSPSNLARLNFRRWAEASEYRPARSLITVEFSETFPYFSNQSNECTLEFAWKRHSVSCMLGDEARFTKLVIFSFSNYGWPKFNFGS